MASEPPKEFSKFSILLTEIRLMIWKAAAENIEPRIVELQKENSDINARGTPPPLPLITKSKAPALLLACREANEVASESYKRAFVVDTAPASTLGIPFNFKRDTLLLNSWEFTHFFLYHGDHQVPIGRSVGTESSERVENLALCINRNDYIDWGTTMAWGSQDSPEFHRFIADFLKKFKNLKNLTIVGHHVGSHYYQGKWENPGDLSFCAPYDMELLEDYVDSWAARARFNFHVPRLPLLELGAVALDIEKLSALQPDKPDTLCKWRNLNIEYKVVAPTDYLPFIRWLEHRQERSQGKCPASSDVEEGHWKDSALSVMWNAPRRDVLMGIAKGRYLRDIQVDLSDFANDGTESIWGKMK